MRSLDRQDNFSSIGHLIIASSGGDAAFSDTDIDFATLAPNHLPPRGFMVATTGDVKIMTLDGKTDTYLNGELVVGLLYPFSIKRVFATGTNITKCRIYW